MFWISHYWIDLKKLNIEVNNGVFLEILTISKSTEETKSNEVTCQNISTLALKQLKEKQSKTVWKETKIFYLISWHVVEGNESFPTNILKFPLSSFKYFIDYSTQIDIIKPARIISAHVSKYLGMCKYMSIPHVPTCWVIGTRDVMKKCYPLRAIQTRI